MNDIIGMSELVIRILSSKEHGNADEKETDILQLDDDEG